MDNIKDNIQKLLDSDITNYRIYKDTGIAQSTLSDLKNGKTTIDSMRLDNALKLNEYYLKKIKNKCWHAPKIVVYYK